VGGGRVGPHRGVGIRQIKRLPLPATPFLLLPHIPPMVVGDICEHLHAMLERLVRVGGFGAEDEVGIFAVEALTQPEAGL